MEKGAGLKMYFLLNMEYAIAMLVYQRVCFFCCVILVGSRDSKASLLLLRWHAVSLQPFHVADIGAFFCSTKAFNGAGGFFMFFV